MATSRATHYGLVASGAQVQVPLEVPGRPVLRPPPPGGDPDRDPDSTITVICTADGFDLGSCELGVGT